MLVSFKKVPKVKFEKSTALAIKEGIKAMEQDFKGMGYDPNFDLNLDNLRNYCAVITSLTQEQKEAVKDIFNL